MKKTINLTKTYIISILIFLFGFISFFYILNIEIKTKNAYSLEKFSLENLKIGDYVKGPFTSALNKSRTNRSYDVNNSYEIIAVEDIYGRYIEVYVGSDKNIEGFFDSSIEQPIFLGEVVKLQEYNNNINDKYRWYETSLGIETKEEVDNLVENSFIIKEIKSEDSSEDNSLVKSVLIMIVGIVIFYFNGGFKNLIVTSNTTNFLGSKDSAIRIFELGIDDADQYKSLQMLESEEKNLKAFYSKELELYNFARIGVFLIAIGAIILCVVINTAFVFIGIFSLILFVVGIKNIIIYYLNSSNKNAIKIAKFFQYETLNEKIEKCDNNIKRLKKITSQLEDFS